MDSFVEALVKEIRLKGEANPGRSLETFYLGGGTPSLLSTSQLEKIINAIHKYNSFESSGEWTIECNPDDLNAGMLKRLRKTGFNRLSIGVQSFHEKDLLMMRRSHNAKQAEASVRLASSEGFDLISMDLIFGIPGQAPAEWEKNLDLALSLPVSHLSAYHLTFEPGTVFDHWRKKGRLMPVPEEKSIEQYRILREKMQDAGFDHYELSNFGKEGIVSKHNMLYWSGQAYLGLGPSAHSFDGDRRSWNISSLKNYMENLASGKEISETEKLTSSERYHDYLITSLRTKWGAGPTHIEESFGLKYRRHFERKAQIFLETGSMLEVSGRLVIEPGQWLITDHILRSLFMP